MGADFHQQAAVRRQRAKGSRTGLPPGTWVDILMLSIIPKANPLPFSPTYLPVNSLLEAPTHISVQAVMQPAVAADVSVAVAQHDPVTVADPVALTVPGLGPLLHGVCSPCAGSHFHLARPDTCHLVDLHLCLWGMLDVHVDQRRVYGGCPKNTYYQTPGS